MFSPCILVIDREVRLLVKLEAAMRQAGYRVLTASDSRQGISLAQAARPEVIICDAAIASMTGPGLRQTLAEDPATSSIPVIVMTTRKARAGVAASIAKPFDPQDLVARVNEVIRSHAYG